MDANLIEKCAKAGFDACFKGYIGDIIKPDDPLYPKWESDCALRDDWRAATVAIIAIYEQEKQSCPTG